MASRGVRLLAFAWVLAAAAQTSSEELAESTLAVPNATNASTTCDIIVRIGYPEGLAPYAVAAPTRYSPPGSRTNASTPREVSWTDPEEVEQARITLQPSLPKEPSPDRTLRV